MYGSPVANSALTTVPRSGCSNSPESQRPGLIGKTMSMGEKEHRVTSPLLGTVIAVHATVGSAVSAGKDLIVIESMKMEHPVSSAVDGAVALVHIAVGDTVEEGQLLLTIAPGVVAPAAQNIDDTPSAERQDLLRYQQRRYLTTDAARPEAMAKRHSRGHRSARENIADLVDEGSFQEFGSFAIAAQRQRRTMEDLIANTPGDGLVGGIATINSHPCAVVSYDYTVLAGTQGLLNHIKKDRLFALIAELRLPVILFAEGGGGRPGDTDASGVTGLHTMAFALFGQLSGLVPMIGITSGYCFAGNAALLGCCDVIIATENSNIGMAGPAMIEGGGLGKVAATDIGPIDVQTKNGVVDIRVADEAAAVAAAKKYFNYFVQPRTAAQPGNEMALRNVVPEQRTRIYVLMVVNFLSCAPPLVLASSQHYCALKVLLWGFLPTTLHTSVAQSIQMQPIKPHDSFNYATHTIFLLSRCATHQVLWLAPKQKKQPKYATSAACLLLRAASLFLGSPWFYVRAMALVHKQWQAAVSTPHRSRCLGQRVNSAAWV
ncbi:MAG: hypothetical protein RL576_993 [Actinomycetota bacterium]